MDIATKNLLAQPILNQAEEAGWTLYVHSMQSHRLDATLGSFFNLRKVQTSCANLGLNLTGRDLTAAPVLDLTEVIEREVRRNKRDKCINVTNVT